MSQGMTERVKMILDEQDEAQKYQPAGTPSPGNLPDVAGFARLMQTDLTDDELSVLKDKLVWGNHGPTGDRPLRYLRLAQMDTKHLENVLFHMGLRPLMRKVIYTILRDRVVNNVAEGKPHDYFAGSRSET